MSMQECVILRVASQHLENRMIASLPEAINQEQDKTWAPNHSLPAQAAGQGSGPGHGGAIL